MADHPNAAVMRQALTAFVAGDAAAMLDAFDDDVVWHAPGTNRFSGRFDGKGEVAGRFRRMADAGVVNTFDVHDVVANDEHAIALVHVRIEDENGSRYEGPQVQVIHMRNGKATELWGMNQDQAALDVVLGS
jgi:ketosteroid isomerase-like protein